MGMNRAGAILKINRYLDAEILPFARAKAEDNGITFKADSREALLVYRGNDYEAFTESFLKALGDHPASVSAVYTPKDLCSVWNATIIKFKYSFIKNEEILERLLK